MSALQVPLTCVNASVVRGPDERELTRGLIPHIAALIRATTLRISCHQIDEHNQ
jgi:hypothetical protein